MTSAADGLEIFRETRERNEEREEMYAKDDPLHGYGNNKQSSEHPLINET